MNIMNTHTLVKPLLSNPVLFLSHFNSKFYSPYHSRYLSFVGEWSEAPLTWYKVKLGLTYRFRVIHMGTIYPLRISVDEHNITVIASDGCDLKPKVVESFIINPG